MGAACRSDLLLEQMPAQGGEFGHHHHYDLYERQTTRLTEQLMLGGNALEILPLKRSMIEGYGLDGERIVQSTRIAAASPQV